jgi:hypothetical protein
MAGLLEVINRHDGHLYYVSVIKCCKSLKMHHQYDFLRLDLTFNFRYEAVVWNKQPIPLFTKPILILNLDDGASQPSITKEEFSRLIKLVLRDEPIECLVRNDVTNDVFKKCDVLSVHNDNGALFFLRKVKQVALMIRADHAPNVRAILSAARTEGAMRCTGSQQEAKRTAQPVA